MVDRGLFTPQSDLELQQTKEKLQDVLPRFDEATKKNQVRQTLVLGQYWLGSGPLIISTILTRSELYFMRVRSCKYAYICMYA